MLPSFDLEPAQEVVEIGSKETGKYKLTKLYSLTPNEEDQVIGILEQLQELEEGEKPDRKMTRDLHCSLATVALRRLSPDVSEAEVRQSLPGALVADLAEFILDERRGWKEAQPSQGKPKSTGRNTDKSSAKRSTKSSKGSPPAGPKDSEATTSETSPSA
ncbi:MAG: hypothetical protein ACFB0C_19510 [Leptolyngbyaceae cyanobacterium]